MSVSRGPSMLSAHPNWRFRLGLAVLAASLGFYALVVLRSAWLSDDAFITFRTVDNFLNGYGLRWNVGERVQAYTHPLWLLLVALASSLTQEIPYTAVFLSVLVSLAAIVLLFVGPRVSLAGATLGTMILCCSKAYVDYSTSGLENPLIHLLLAAYFWLYLDDKKAQRQLFYLFLTASMIGLTRMDALLLVMPSMATVLWRRRSGIWRPLLCGIAPFVAWEAFSLVYYGFLLPNTAYAKLGTRIPAGQLVAQGLNYLLDSLHRDPLTLCALGSGVGLSLLKGARLMLPMSGGIVLYLVYVVRIGGDFMSGRFLTAPLFVATIMVSCLRIRRQTQMLLLALVLLAGVTTPTSPLRVGMDHGSAGEPQAGGRGINDERVVYYEHTGLLPALRGARPYPTHPWANRGRDLRQWADSAPDKRPGFWSSDRTWCAPPGITDGYLATPSVGDNLVISTLRTIGMSGFYGGPRIHIIDHLALGEPLLARLPAMSEEEVHPGHYGRLMPPGYIRTHIHRQNLLADGDLGRFFDALRTVVTGELFSWPRWREIWRLNTGYHDSLIDKAYYRNPGIVERALSEVRIKPIDPSKRILLGLELLRLGRLEDAQRSFSYGLWLYPGSVNNRLTVAQALIDSGHQEAAATTLREGLEVDPTDYELLTSLGAVLLRSGSLDQARVVGLRAIAQAPDSTAAYRIAGAAYMGLGQRDQAIQMFGRLVALDSSDYAAHRNLLALLVKGGLQDRSVALAERITRLNFHDADPEYYGAVGLYLQQKGYHESAIAAYRRALERDSGQATTRVNLGWALYTMGDVDGAIQEYSIALRSEPSSAAHFNLALAQLARGNVELARASYAAGLERYGPEEARAVGAVVNLRELARRGVQAGEARRLIDSYWGE